MTTMIVSSSCLAAASLSISVPIDLSA